MVPDLKADKRTGGSTAADLPAPDFRAIFQALPGLYLVLLPDDPNFTIVVANAAYAEATLTKTEDIVGRGLFEVFPDNPRDKQATGVRNLHASLRRVLATKAPDIMAPQKYDIRRPASGGGEFEERYWSPVNSPVLRPDGQVQFIIHRVEDISDNVGSKRIEAEPGKLAGSEWARVGRIEAEQFLRKRIEEELRQNETRFSVAFAEAPIGMVLSSPDGVILDINQAFLDMLGYTLEEVASQDSALITHPDDVARTREFYAFLREHASAPAVIEKRYVRKDGRILWARASASMRRDAAGRPAQLVGVIEDITERKRAETALRQQWHTFDTALSNTPDFTYVFDLEGRFTYVNRALLSLWEKPLEEAVGKNFFDLGYPPELAARLQRQIQQVIEKPEPLRDHTPFTGPTGETRHYEYIFVPVLGADGQVEAVAGSTRDITERNKAEEAVRISEERLTLALEAGGGVGTWDWDIPKDLVYCNPQFARLFSIPPENAATGAPISLFFAQMHPDDRARVSDSVQEAEATGGEFSEEYRVLQPDGSVRWVYARGRCHLDAQGNPARFPGVVFEITERKRADQALRESQEQLQAVYHGAYEYMGLIAPDGTVLDCNRASLMFAGNTRADVVGRPFWDTPWFSATPGAPEVLRDAVKRAAAGEFIRYEMLLIRPSGEGLTFDFSLHPIRNEQGEVVLLVPEGRDISDRKRAEEDLKRSNQELKRLNRELEEFAFVAGHDLQEPLRMVNIYTEILLSDLGAEKAALDQYAVFIHQGVSRMEALIHDLLTFSRAVHADGLPAGTADLGAALAEALSVLKDRIEENGASISADSLPTVRGDVAQMAHVFQNLLSNAVKYRNPKLPAQVRISAEQAGAYWIVSVRDNGIGFEPQYAERIFGLFKRLHKDEYPGTGLGLAICKRIIERYGGRLWAEGRPGEGSTFYFSLPAAEEH